MSNLSCRTLLLISLSAGLYACQPDTPAQQAEPPAAPPAPAPVAAAPQPVAAAPAAQAAQAASAELQLAQKSKCLACHAIERKLVGPAWKDVAAKYRGQKDAEARLIDKVAKGSGGVWGPVPMPPNAPQVSQGDIKTLVRFILSLK